MTHELNISELDAAQWRKHQLRPIRLVSSDVQVSNPQPRQPRKPPIRE